MEWTDIRLTVAKADAENAEAVATLIAEGGIYIEDYSDIEQQVAEIAHVDLIEQELLDKPRDTVIIHLYLEPGASQVETLALIAARMEAAGIPYTVETEGVEQEDWQNGWRKYYHPMEIGSRLAVVPSWQQYDTDRVKLILDPGLAFGTGGHETTSLCLEALDEQVRGGERVLDIGTGSGILAIAALKLGAASAEGVDIDPVAVRTAGENAALNGVADKLTVLVGDLSDKASGKYDIITANIVANAIMSLAPAVPGLMADNGVFEASGKTAQQMKEMIDAMDDETFIRFFRPYMRAILSMQMQQETVKSYSGMTSQEVISAISAKGISSSQYADVYDNYVASSASGSTYNNNLKKLGYVDKDSPSAINIYASSFENKDQISACIDDYNADAAENDQISYTDYVGLLMSSITTIINAISYVLIGFVAISLVVSSIMIGIITYISVLERTKEIGILRSIGASKQDISRVFNAETLIEGFTAGVMGILCTLILLIPINLIVHHLTGLPTLSAILPVLGAILLILISMALTFIAGLIPSGMAAKKDPVVALRTE